SPKATRSVTARRLRPISRWISWVRPLCLPRAASRSVRVWVERGSIPYSAVTQPLPLLRIHGGTRSSIVAAQSTWVSPNFTRQEPSAYLAKPGSRVTMRMASGVRPEGRMKTLLEQSALAGKGAFRTRGSAGSGQGSSHDIDLAVMEFEFQRPGSYLGGVGDDRVAA